MDGRSTRRRSSPARYCCSDCPCSSARACNRPWTSSGTSLINTFGMLTLCKHSGREASSASDVASRCAPPQNKFGVRWLGHRPVFLLVGLTYPHANRALLVAGEVVTA